MFSRQCKGSCHRQRSDIFALLERTHVQMPPVAECALLPGGLLRVLRTLSVLGSTASVSGFGAAYTACIYSQCFGDAYRCMY